MEEFNGKERMLSDWQDVLVAIFRAQSGESDIKYTRDKDDGIIGVDGELILQFEFAMPIDFMTDSSQAVKVALEEAKKAMSEDGSITSKQKAIIEWFETRNAIIRAESGELKIACDKNEFAGGLIVALVVEWSLQFNEPTESVVSEEEKVVIDDAHK